MAVRIVVHPSGDRSLYYVAKFLAQTAQNLLLATLFVNAGLSGSAALSLSGVFLAMLLPAILFGLVGGALVDRIGAGRGFALGAILRVLPVAAGIAVVGDVRLMWIVAFGFSIGSQISNPAEMALVRTLQQGAASRMHGVIVAVQYGGQAAGALVLAPALYFLGGTGAILSGALVGCTAVAVLATTLAWRLRGTPACQAQPTRSAISFRQTCRFFASEERARYAVVVTAFKVIVMRGIVVALPIYLNQDIGLGREAVVYLFLPGVAGAAVGLLWAARAVTLERAQPVMRLALVGMIVSVVALAAFDYGIELMTWSSQIGPIIRFEAYMNTTFIVALPVAFLLGLSLSGALIAARVALTETAPLGQQARVFATQATITEAFLVLPLLLTGVGTQFAGARVTLGAIGLLTLGAFLVLELPRLVDRRRHGDSLGPVLDAAPVAAR